MTACLAIGAVALQLASGTFTLHWMHSIEHVAWEEDWQVNEQELSLIRSRIKGSGAGMEPGPDAIWQDGWWVTPGALRLPALTLASSGKTGEGWSICADGSCREVGMASGLAITLQPCVAADKRNG